jgi:hypothetical protein
MQRKDIFALSRLVPSLASEHQPTAQIAAPAAGLEFGGFEADFHLLLSTHRISAKNAATAAMEITTQAHIGKSYDFGSGPSGSSGSSMIFTGCRNFVLHNSGPQVCPSPALALVLIDPAKSGSITEKIIW